MAKQKMNVRLLRRIQKHILAEPRRYDQTTWGIKTNGETGTPPCGTQACIAGWAAVLGTKINVKNVTTGWFYNASGVASGLLNLDPDESSRLFSYGAGMFGWPLKYYEAYIKAKTPAGRARAASRRIDHFIATNGAE